MEAILALEQSILLFIQENLRFDWLNPIMRFITMLGDAGIMWIILGAAMLFFRKTRRGGLIMLLCLAGACLINDLVLKELIARERPYTVIEALDILVRPETSFSFPSGHTNASFASAFALTKVYGKKGAWAYIPAALIALSRCYVGVHYLTDVLAGMAVGTLMALAVYQLFIYIEKRRRLKKVETK